MTSRKRILIVDDDKAVLKTLCAYLSMKDYSVDVAETGQGAIAKCSQDNFNLAILDIRLPDMMGTELLTRLPEQEPRMMKIMLTGYPDYENSVESLNKGADAYLTKPVEFRELLSVVEEKLNEQEDTLRMDRKRIVRYLETRSRELEEKASSR